MLHTTDRETLGAVARASIRHGLRTGRALAPEADGYSGVLQTPGASFVTLHRHAQLRGCIGSLEPRRALVSDVAENAFAAAFRDPRFSPLREEEWETLRVEISVLSAPQPMAFASEADLLSILRPGVDGLILQEGRLRGTFLPSVWTSLPQPEAFLSHLKQKAGLAQDYWSPTLKVWRYETESFGA